MKKCVIGGFIDTNLREEEKTAISEKKTAFSSFKPGLLLLQFSKTRTNLFKYTYPQAYLKKVEDEPIHCFDA